MTTRARIFSSLLALALASLACSLPLADEPPAPTAGPLPTNTAAPVLTGTLTASPTAVPPALATSFPTLTPLPQNTLSPIPSVGATTVPTLTASVTASATGTPTQATSTPVTVFSPTPPPTVTVPAKSKTPTTTHTSAAANRVIWNAPYFTPTLDGDWSEWKAVSTEYTAGTVVFGRANWSGEADLGASFHVAWDTSYLYVAVKVLDDVYAQNASGANIYQGDSLEVLFDGNYAGDFYTRQLSPDDFQLGLSPGRNEPGGAREAYLWFPRSVQGSKTVKIAAISAEGVYRVEAAIPWSLLEVTPASGARYGFAVSVSDNDNTAANQQDSMVSSAVGRVLADPTTWGELRLK